MTAEIVTEVVGKIVEIAVNPLVNTVGRQFSYIFCYKQNIQTLSQQLQRLEATRDGVQLSTAEAKRNLEIVDPKVELWFKEVDAIKSKATEVLEGTSNAEKGCLNGWCPNLKHGYLLSRKARKLTAGIGELKCEGDKDAKFAHQALPMGIIPSEGPSISPKDDGVKGFPTRVATMNEVMDALNDTGINLIGISGMGGIGKTTLVNQVLEKVKAQRLFSEAAMAVVSQQLNPSMIQGEIARKLGLKFEEGSSIFERAKRLRERLKNGGKVLVVLDDIWERVDLGEVGIPAENGCKVVFTTRMERACTEMAAQKHIKVVVLSDQEAWNLFREATGDCVEDEDLCDIAKEVAKECGGLPIAVVTLGKALSKREKCEWEDTLLQLKRSSGMEEKVQSSLMLSYNFLESRRPNAQPLLLLCSLFEEDENIPIEQLVKYSMGLELFDDVETLEETRNRVHSLLNSLKSCNLVLQGDAGDYLCVKLHDVIRDLCLLIASNSPHAYLVRHAKEMKKWPQQNRSKADILTAIALKSGAMNELPGGLDYPNLRLLQLQFESENINMAGDFFQGMRGLQVFKFDGMINFLDGGILRCDVILPPTLQLLTNLQTLSLEYCKLGGDLSSIGWLKGLKILSFYESQLDEFPSEVVGELKNLKLLDLRFSYISRSLNIEACVLSGLDQLEVLYMGKYVFSKSIKELNSLCFLTSLQMCISNLMILLELEEPFLKRLKRFDIFTGYAWFSCDEYGIIRNNISQYDGNLSWVSHTELGSLVRRIQSFTLNGLDEDRFMLDERSLGLSALYNLESLEICNMKNLREISHESKIPRGSFQQLQKMHLRELPALKHLWRGPAQPPSLSNLRALEIEGCVSIESLFSPNVAKCMLQLETLEIDRCYSLRGVVSNEGKEDDDKGFKQIQLPKLNYIHLKTLPDLKGFYPDSGNEDLDGKHGIIHSLFNQWVSFPSLEKIIMYSTGSVERIVGYQMQDGLANNLRSIEVYYCEELRNFVDSTMLEKLEEVDIRYCESMEVVFDWEGLKVGGEDSPFVFDKLEFINLYDLEKLAHVWRMDVPDGIQGFRNLKILDVERCNELRYLISYSVAKMLVNLQVLRLSSCPEVVGVIEEEDGQESSMDFPQLQKLILVDLKKLTSFCSSKCSLEFLLLGKVVIKDCPNMKSFCGGEVKAPVLKEPVEDSKGEQWMWEGNLNNGNYSGKREVEVEVESRSTSYGLDDVGSWSQIFEYRCCSR